METTLLTEQLTNNGWHEENIKELASNSLNNGTTAYFIYQNKLSLRYHAKENFIRLMVYGKSSNEAFAVNYISKIDKALDKFGYNDVRGFQIDCQKNITDVVKSIIELQDAIKLDSYFDFYMKIQFIGDVSILAVEQFI